MTLSSQRTSPLGITARLNGVFAVVTLLVLVSSGVSLNSLAALAAQVTHTGRVTGERALLCGRLQGLSGKMRGAVRGVLLYSRTEQPDLVSRSSREFGEFSTQVRTIASRLGNGEGSAEEVRAAKELTEAVNDWQPVLNEIAGLCARKDFGPAVADATRRSIAAADRVDAATELLVQAQTAGFEASVRGSEEVAWRARAEAVAFAVLTALACLAGLYAVRGATRVLRQVSESLAAGSSQVRAAAQHVSGASQSLAQGACEQAASLQETAASTQQIKSMIGLNAEGSASAALSMKDSHSHIEEANLRLEQLRDAMKEIADSGAKISGIVKEIDAIAFQTNLLALNASIEAARAGAHGAGFAVVADEIRNLSARSAGSARNTAVLIEEAVAR
jgi:methyl-accepting chemotaxis protein